MTVRRFIATFDDGTTCRVEAHPCGEDWMLRINGEASRASYETKDLEKSICEIASIWLDSPVTKLEERGPCVWCEGASYVGPARLLCRTCGGSGVAR